jgi:hypothetical protein
MNLCARSKLIWVAILVGSMDWSAIAVRAGSAKTPSAIGSEPQQQPSGKVPVLDTLIVPGKRAGAITSKTTSNDLTNLFGKQRLTPKKFYGAQRTNRTIATAKAVRTYQIPDFSKKSGI